MHVFNWAIRTKPYQDIFLQMLKGHRGPSNPVVRFEPSLNRVIDMALGEGLVRKANRDVLELTDKGLTMAQEIWKNESLLRAEKQFLSEIEGKFTQQQTSALLRWEPRK
jgi:hypothetical protein